MVGKQILSLFYAIFYGNVSGENAHEMVENDKYIIEYDDTGNFYVV